MKKLLIGVVVVISLLIGINSYSQYQREVFNFDNEKITYAKLDGQYSLINGDNHVDLP